MSSESITSSPFACPHCGGLQPRFASRAGLTVTCPDCGTRFVVGVPAPPPAEPSPAAPPRAASQAPASKIANDIDIGALWPPTAESRPAPREPVKEPPTGSAAADDIDIGELWPSAEPRPAPRPPTKELPVGSEAADEINTYELLPPRVEKRPSAWDDEDLKRAERRLHEPAARKPAAREPAVRGVGARGPEGSTPTKDVSDTPVGWDEEAAREERLHRFRHVPDAPPKLVFLSGVFDFPFHPGAWQRWIAMSAAALVSGWLVVSTLTLLGVLSGGGPQRESIQGLLLGLPTTVVAAIAGGYITACLLEVIQDTASGCWQIHEWPESDWREWVLTLRFPLVAGFCALLPGALIEYLDGHWHVLGSLLAVLVLPILLLSQLESDSAAMPLSGPILRTCVTHRWAWLVFYVETGLMFALWAWIVHLSVTHAPDAALLFLPPVTIALLLIYCRLLGRLAWYVGWEKEETDPDHPAADVDDAGTGEP